MSIEDSFSHINYLYPNQLVRFLGVGNVVVVIIFFDNLSFDNCF